MNIRNYVPIKTNYDLCIIFYLNDDNMEEIDIKNGYKIEKKLMKCKEYANKSRRIICSINGNFIFDIQDKDEINKMF